jgi:O-antigen ligase
MSSNSAPATWLPELRTRVPLAQTMAQIGVFTLMLAALLMPAIKVRDDLPYLKAEQVLLPFVFLIHGWLMLAGYVKRIRFNGLLLIGMFYCLSILLSMWFGAEVLHHQVLSRDFYEIPKAVLPIVFFTIGYEAELSNASLRNLMTILVFAVLLICLYAWAQFLHLPFTQWLDPYYSAGSPAEMALNSSGRVFSTMGNPNVLSELMTWSFVAFTMAMLHRVGSPIRNMAMAFACLITIVMTGSRYGLLTASLGILLIFGISWGQSRQRVARLSLLLVLLPIFAWTFVAVASTNQITLQRFETLKHPLEADSVRGRLDSLWLDAADEIAKSPVVGHGPAKTMFTGIITDSEYLDVLKEFGVVGFLLYLSYFFFPMSLMWKGLRAARLAGPSVEDAAPATLLTLRLAFVMSSVALVMNLGMSTFYNLLLQGYLWLWMGLGARSAQSISEALQGGSITYISVNRPRAIGPSRVAPPTQ